MHTAVGQELLESTSRLVKDWADVYAICPASLPPAQLQKLRQRSKCFSSILEDHQVNLFWLEICHVTKGWVPPASSLFQPVRHRLPFADFANVVVLVSGYGDGVRRGIANAVAQLGGECAFTLSPCFTYAPVELTCSCSDTLLGCTVGLIWAERASHVLQVH